MKQTASKGVTGLPRRGQYDVCIVGGAGHIGAPLGILLGSRGLRTLLFDINTASMTKIAAGTLPFFEEGGDKLLHQVLASDMLGFTADAADVRGIPYLVITVGTPIDEFHNPALRVI